MKLKKLVVIVITLIAAVSLMAGCGKSAKEDYTKIEKNLKADGWDVELTVTEEPEHEEKLVAQKGNERIGFMKNDEKAASALMNFYDEFFKDKGIEAKDVELADGFKGKCVVLPEGFTVIFAHEGNNYVHISGKSEDDCKGILETALGVKK